MSSIDRREFAPLPICKFNPTAEGLERWLGELETPIMENLWSADLPRTVKRVWKDITPTYGAIAYTTVMTTMSRLWGKGMLDRRRKGLAYVYSVRETREEFEERQMAAIRESLEK